MPSAPVFYKVLEVISHPAIVPFDAVKNPVPSTPKEFPAIILQSSEELPFIAVEIEYLFPLYSPPLPNAKYSTEVIFPCPSLFTILLVSNKNGPFALMVLSSKSIYNPTPVLKPLLSIVPLVPSKIIRPLPLLPRKAVPSILKPKL
jgi:hypothetical protein